MAQRSARGTLDQATINAVMQWSYKPNLLNGTPVPVFTTVTVVFN